MKNSYDSYTEDLWNLASQAKHAGYANNQLPEDDAKAAFQKLDEMALEFTCKYAVDIGFAKKMAFHVADTCNI